MSELYHHLLVPRNAAFVPDLASVARFYRRLKNLGALPEHVRFTAITHTGNTRVIGQNPKTGEEYYGPELNILREQELQPALDAIRDEELFDLSAHATGPATVPPFDLYSADNYADRRPGALCQEPYPFSVRCKLRPKITHFLHSFFGCNCEIKPDDPAIFANPWNGKPMHTSGIASARFWIDIGIGNWLMPIVGDSLNILDSRLAATTSEAFGIEFTQGCFRNDD
jgi:hypothetical protein